MTVNLLKPYATFAQGASVDLDNATEASLVAQGLGVYTSNPGSAYSPLTPAEEQALRDSAFRAIPNQGNAIPPPMRLSNVMARGFVGSIAAQNFSGSTFSYHSTVTAEQAFTQVRIWLPNMSATENIVAQTKVAVSNAIGADPVVGGSNAARYTPSTATWVSVTFGGAAAVTLPAAVTTTANSAEPSWTPSDWIDLASIARTDGGTLPILMMRSLVNSGQNYATSPYPIPEWQKAVSTINNGRVWTCYRYTGDGLTTPTTFVYTTDLGGGSGTFHVRFEYRGVSPGLTIAGSGDSISDGAVNGSTGNYGNGWLWQATNLLRAANPSLPIDLVLLSYSSTLSASFLQRTQRFVASDIHYDLLTYSPFSPNDTLPSQAFLTSQLKQWNQMSELLGRGVFVTLPTIVPTVGASPWAYAAQANGTVVLAGGTVSAVTLTRGASAAVTFPIAGPIPVLAGDIVTVTHTGAPTFTLIPDGSAVVPGRPMVLTTPCPNTAGGWTAAQDAFRISMRNFVLAARATGAPVIDFDAVLSDGVTPARYIAAYTTDGTHPNEGGSAVAAAAAFPVLNRLIPPLTTA